MLTVVIALAVTALVLIVIRALVVGPPLPDFADPDVADVPLEEFLDASTEGADRD